MYLNCAQGEREIYRRAYKDAIAVCRNVPLEALERGACSWDVTLHYLFDYAQQVHIPSNLMQLSICISSCHKALTFSFHSLQFAAKALTVIHDCHSATRLSSSTILLHVVFGRPGLLLPSGLHSNAVTQCSSVLPHYMSNPIPSSASDLITCSVHSCGLLNLLV